MISLPRLATRATWLMAVGVFALVIGAGVYVAVTQPEHLTGVLVGCPLLCLAFIVILWQTTALDPAAGRIIRTRCGVFRRTLELAQVSKVGVGGNGAGAALLGLKAAGPKVYVPVLHLTDLVKRSQSPSVLTALADALERFVTVDTPGREESISRLRAQAAFTGAPQDSPLAPLVSDTFVKAGESVGASISIFKLLD